MNREIKFRGQDIMGNWHYGLLTILKQKVNHLEPGSYISNSVGMPFAYQVRPETVGQYVGKKDIKGQEIYEGDRLKCSAGPGFRKADSGTRLVKFIDKYDYSFVAVENAEDQHGLPLGWWQRLEII